VYISYPFCAQKCTYCNFASGVLPEALRAPYVDALRAEIRSTEWPWTPETVYLGGGTPSQMNTEALEAVLREIPGHPWREATIEAAPGGITRETVAEWRRVGIDRVSLGVQSFVQRELARTGRKHTAEIVAREVATLREAGIENFNIDLIAGLPGQTAESWEESLAWVKRLEAPHVSVYMLEVDEDSRLGAEVLAFGKRYGARDIPSDDAIAAFYETAVERLAAMGVARYEISNFARSGYESRHNLKYWLREPYLGFGADAHSFDCEYRWANVESAAEYVRCTTPRAERTLADPVSERFFLGLRLDRGIEMTAEDEAIQRFVNEGLLRQEGSRVKLTPRGVLLSNEVFGAFV
jgi:oxygen-independent coproporphyrinogen-3 oxidase